MPQVVRGDELVGYGEIAIVPKLMNPAASNIPCVFHDYLPPGPATDLMRPRRQTRDSGTDASHGLVDEQIKLMREKGIFLDLTPTFYGGLFGNMSTRAS